MPHILAKLNGVKFKEIETILKADAKKHAEKGLYLEQLWQNIDNPNEVYFLFRTTNIKNAKQYIESEHINALQQDPNSNLPEMTYLE